MMVFCYHPGILDNAGSRNSGLRYPNFRPYADAYSAVVVVPARARIIAISSRNGRADNDGQMGEIVAT